MKPLAIDFAPTRRINPRLRWFAGAMAALTLVLASAAWLLPPPAEAGHMTAPETISAPGLDEAQAVDKAVRRLNASWAAIFNGLEDCFDTPAAGLLHSVELDPARAVLRINGAARDRATVLAMPARAIVKGDAKVQAIAAASILAKVHRDRLCLELHERYPQYGFAAHKGYPTVEHLRALRTHGASPEHRRSFAPVRLAGEAP